jgi:hypothetical protein
MNRAARPALPFAWASPPKWASSPITRTISPPIWAWRRRRAARGRRRGRQRRRRIRGRARVRGAAIRSSTAMARCRRGWSYSLLASLGGDQSLGQFARSLGQLVDMSAVVMKRRRPLGVVGFRPIPETARPSLSRSVARFVRRLAGGHSDVSLAHLQYSVPASTPEVGRERFLARGGDFAASWRISRHAFR